MHLLWKSNCLIPNIYINFYTATVERLNEEFYKVLKSCDAHSNEYVDRLKDEDRVMSILETAQGILEKSKTPSEMCRIYLQRVDHIYFKFDQNVIKQRNVSVFLLKYSWILSVIYIEPHVLKL